MSPVSTIIIGGLTVAATAVCYALTHSIVLAILIFLASYLICRNLQPFISQKWRSAHPSRLPQLHEFRVKNMPVEDGAPQGFRLLAMTEYLEPGPKTQPVYKEIAGAALEALSQQSPLFALRLSAVRQREHPEQYVCALCGADGKNMRKCLKSWVRSDALRNMRSKTQNRDLFLYDGAIGVPGEENEVPYTVLVLFDSTLPVTLPKAETE